MHNHSVDSVFNQHYSLGVANDYSIAVLFL